MTAVSFVISLSFFLITFVDSTIAWYVTSCGLGVLGLKMFGPGDCCGKFSVVTLMTSA